MRRGDVYMVDLDPTEGSEQRGFRPVVIVSPDDFNRITGLPVIVPVTQGSEFARRIGFSVTLMGAGTQTVGVVRCDQPRVLNLKVRKGRKVESLPPVILDEILGKVATIFE